MGIGPKFSKTDTARLGEPQAHRFEIVRAEQVGANVVAYIRYLDASEYGGMKLLVYRSVSVNALTTADVLDPHFLENSPSFTPFARFEPTDEGLAAAFEVAELI